MKTLKLFAGKWLAGLLCAVMLFSGTMGPAQAETSTPENGDAWFSL